MILELILGLCVYLLWLFYRDNYSEGNKPPGPLKLPLIGNLHQLASTGETLSFKALDILAKRYGPIMSLKMGMKEAIIITGYEDMSSLLTRSECDGRVFEKFLHSRSFGKPMGILMSSGEEWQTIRRFTISHLRDFGFGNKNSLEYMMNEELSEFMSHIDEQINEHGQGGLIHVDNLFNASLLNVLWLMVCYQRYPYDNPKIKRLLNITELLFKSGDFGSDISVAFPFLTGFTTSSRRMSDAFKELHVFFKEIIDDRKRESESLSSSSCLVDVFLNKIQESKNRAGNTNSTAEEYFTEEQLIVVLLDLFLTGSETLGGALSYGILFMILHPEVQRKVQQEIDQVVEKGENLRFEHKSKMIYTQAVLMEILRMGDIVPIIPPRQVLSDFHYKGYLIPKGSTIIPNLHSVMRNEKYFKNPHSFIPQRFIDPNGKLITCKFLSPFGFGKRYCMEESQATAGLFLYFTTFLKHFTLSIVPNEETPIIEPLPAFTLTPQPFNMIIKRRK